MTEDLRQRIHARERERMRERELMSEKPQKTMEFVAPDWLKKSGLPLNLHECTIEKCTNGKFAIVSHEYQCTLFVADTKEELQVAMQ